MASTKINIGEVVNSGSIVVQARQKVGSTKNVVDDVNWKLDGKIKSRNNIGGRLSSLSGTLGKIENNISKTVGVVERSANGYLQADNRVVAASKDLSDESIIDVSIGIASGSGAPPLLSPDFSGNRPPRTEENIGIVEERKRDALNFVMLIASFHPVGRVANDVINTVLNTVDFATLLSEHLKTNNGNLMGTKGVEKFQLGLIDLMISSAISSCGVPGSGEAAKAVFGAIYDMVSGLNSDVALKYLKNAMTQLENAQ